MTMIYTGKGVQTRTMRKWCKYTTLGLPSPSWTFLKISTNITVAWESRRVGGRELIADLDCCQWKGDEAEVGDGEWFPEMVRARTRCQVLIEFFWAGIEFGVVGMFLNTRKIPFVLNSYVS